MPYCPNCNAQLRDLRTCWNCDASFEAESAWKPQAKPLGPVRKFRRNESPRAVQMHRLGITRMSLGKNPLARKFGNFLLIVSAVFAFAALVKGINPNPNDLDFSQSLLVSGFLLFSAFSIRCFLHGEDTWLHYRIKTTTVADRTALRVLGLGIDTFFWCCGVFALKSW
jgi:hypothetical protein